MLLARESEVENGLCVGLALLNDRLVDLLRQTAADPAHAIANIRRRVVGIAVELEGDGDLARFLAADRGDEVDALDAGKRVLEHLGDLRLHDGGARAGIIGLHRDDRRVDRRILSDAEPVVGDEAHQNEDETHYGGENRSA